MPDERRDETVRVRGDNPGVGLGRIAWSVVSIAFAVAGLVLLMQSYYGYSGVTFAVAAAAGINLL